jgi:hypothetical protein
MVVLGVRVTEPLLRLVSGIVASIAVCVIVFAALSGSLQLAIAFVGVLVGCVLQSRIAVVVFVVCMIPSLSLLRRLAAGDAAYLESDPLILLPLILVAGVTFYSWTRPRTDDSPDVVRLLALLVVTGIVVAVALRAAFSVNGLFFAGLVIVPMLLAVALSNGRLPPVWPAVSRALPALALAAGIYGIVQFLVLPTWDRSWMISSELTSIGAPYPQQVRVFGASESPGPYAVFMGIGLTVVLCRAVLAEGVTRRVGWLLTSVGIAVPLLLSGVRSSLLAVVVCVALLVATRAKGFARIALIAFLAVGYQLMNVVISRFGSQSTILSQDRYSDLSNDVSLLARLELLRYLANPLSYLVGNPNAPAVDNLYIDVLVRYGLLPAIALFALVVVVAMRATRLLRMHQNETAALCVWFLLVQSMFGNIFNALIGILVGIIVGTVMSRSSEKAELSAPVVSAHAH